MAVMTMSVSQMLQNISVPSRVRSLPKYLLSAAFITCLGVPLAPVSAQDSEVLNYSYEQLREIFKAKIRTVQHMALNPTSIREVRKQNIEKLPMTLIKQRDEKWSSTDDLTPFKLALQKNVAGKYLRNQIERNPYLLEAFLTDNKGANVAAFPATSDYWQGDESKWTDAYDNGKGHIFLGEPEVDESLGTLVIQVGAPVIDRGQTIGVLVVSVDIGYVKQVNN